MVVDLQVPVWTVKESVRYTMRTEKDELFPILDIDKDSYIVAAKVESGINWYWEAGIYNLQVGKFSSVAEDVLFMIDCNHDYRSVFQGCVSAIRDGNNQIQKLKRKGQIIIQNDCWIGHGATIMGGVTIHNGAVVAANSTVTKDVPAYAIVGGNPAKIIGYRFESEIIEKLLQIAWWDWTDEQIAENEELLRGDVSQFVNIFEKQTKYDLIENPVTRMQKGKLFVFYLDMSERFSLWEKVVDEFVKKFQGTDNELLLYFSPLELSDMSYSEKLLEKLEIYNDYDCYINIYSEIMEDDTILLKDADYYITNRLPGNIKRMCAAEQFGVTCISGVDSKIF